MWTVMQMSEKRDLAEDPRACSLCGTLLAFSSDEYCDHCARQVGAKPPLERCMHCGNGGPQEQMESVDISTEDEYYPEIRYLCRSCSGSDTNSAADDLDDGGDR